jgi:dolichol-phosphate mannosyltransferase
MSAVAREVPDLSSGVWIALPTYNERDNLEPMLLRLLEVAPSANILVVDDSSPDGTGDLADHLATTHDRVHVLHRAGKEGLGAAYRAAFAHLLAMPNCEVIVQMDCDFSHDPADVARLLATLDQGAGLAIGSRYVPGGQTPGWSLSRRLISRGGSGFARVVLDLPLSDLTGGFKAWRADLLRSIDLGGVEAAGYGFQVEMTWRAFNEGAVIREIPIIFGERRAGRSKMSRRIVVEALLMVLRLRRRGARGSWRSADLPASRSLRTGPVRVARGEPIDDEIPTTVLAMDGPARGSVATDRAGQSEALG